MNIIITNRPVTTSEEFKSMYGIKISKAVLGIAFAGVVALATAASAPAQEAHSYCYKGGGSMMPPQCGFATIAQCLNQGAGFGFCVPSDRALDPAFAGVNANAKLIKPVHKRHAR
jgi:hypothetical protein